MKKILFLIVLAALALAAPARAQDNDHYVFGMIMGRSSNDQQLKPIFQDLFKFMSEYLKVDLELAWYMDMEDFNKALEEGTIDFGYAKEHDSFLKMVLEYGYEPVATVTAFGKEKNSVCLYARSDRDIQSIDDMEGLKVLTYYTRDGYYPLRQVLGDRKPEDFFGETIPSLSGQISLRKLLNNEADVAFLYDSNVDLLKMGNPAVVKEIKPVVCAPEMYNPGIVVNSKKNIPDKLVQDMTKIFEKADKAPTMKKYKSMLKTTGIKFIPIKKAGYKSMFDMYAEAEKKGWDKDYAAWLKTLPEAKEE